MNAIAGFGRRMLLAAANMLIPLQTAVILYYFIGQWTIGETWPLVQSLGYILPWLFLPLVGLLPLALWRRSRVLLAMTVCCLVLFVGVYGRLFLPRPPLQTTNPTFTIMSYNVLFVNKDLEATKETIARYDPDVLALHEYTRQVAEVLHPWLAERYPYYEVVNGRGFYTRYPIDYYEFIPIPRSFGKGGQWVRLNIDGQLVSVFSVHPYPPRYRKATVPGVGVQLPLGISDGRDHQTQMALILAEIDRDDYPLVLVGDLNMTDQNPLFARLRTDLKDAFWERGSGFGFTFTPFRNYPLPIWRIDFILHSPSLTAVSAEVGDFGGSDHRPVIATLALPDPPAETVSAP